MASLDEQRAVLEAWLASDDARRSARRLITRHRLDIEPDDLLHDCFARLRASFDRRAGEPYPDLDTVDTAARFGYRAMDNICRDLARARRRRGELVSIDTAAVDTGLDPVLTSGSRTLGFDGDTASSVEQRLLLEHLLLAVGRVTHDPAHRCPGCPVEVAAAVALETVHLMLRGDAGDDGAAWFDRLLYQALERVDPDPERSAEATRQRKLRCGRCAREFLAAGMTAMGMVGQP